MHKKYAVIVAAGTGSRMGGDLPKQYLLLDGKPVLMHTVEKFAVHPDLNLVLVLHPAMEDYWGNLCRVHGFAVPHAIVHGGATRFQSVRNAVDFILEKEPDPGRCIVAIHDAARPFVSPGLIEKSYQATAVFGATVAAVAAVSSIRMGSVGQNTALDRSKVWLVQTPQTFTADLLAEGFKQQESETFTDDASVIEKMGHPIHIIEGEQGNIKLTHPEDLPQIFKSP